MNLGLQNSRDKNSQKKIDPQKKNRVQKISKNNNKLVVCSQKCLEKKKFIEEGDEFKGQYFYRDKKGIKKQSTAHKNLKENDVEKKMMAPLIFKNTKELKKNKSQNHIDLIQDNVKISSLKDKQRKEIKINPEIIAKSTSIIINHQKQENIKGIIKDPLRCQNCRNFLKEKNFICSKEVNMTLQKNVSIIKEKKDIQTTNIQSNKLQQDLQQGEVEKLLQVISSLEQKLKILSKRQIKPKTLQIYPTVTRNFIPSKSINEAESSVKIQQSFVSVIQKKYSHNVDDLANTEIYTISELCQHDTQIEQCNKDDDDRIKFQGLKLSDHQMENYSKQVQLDDKQLSIEQTSKKRSIIKSTGITLQSNPKVVRPYCKKNCGQFCVCLTNMIKIIK